MQHWLRSCLQSAVESLEEAGVPRACMKNIRVKIFWGPSTCRAYYMSGGSTIFIWGWWASLAMMNGYIEDIMVRLLRHEIGHLLLDRYDGLKRSFGIGEYIEPTEWYRFKTAVLYGYGSVNEEEGFCEDLADLIPSTTRKVKKVLGRLHH